MNELMKAAIPKGKVKITSALLKSALVLIVVGVIYTGLMVTASAILKPYVSEDVYSFFSAQFFVGLSAVLYGFIVEFYRSNSLANYGLVLKKITGPLLLTMLLAHLFIIFGYVLLILPGVLLTLFFLFYPFVIIDEKKQNLAALKRSGQLFKKVWFSVLLSVIGFYLLFLVIGAFIILFLPVKQLFAEIIAGTVVIPVEAYVYYRLFNKASARLKAGKGGDVSDRASKYSASAAK